MLSPSEIPNVLDMIRQQERERFAEEVRALAIEREGPPYHYNRITTMRVDELLDRVLGRPGRD